MLLRQGRHRFGERVPLQPVGFDALGEELARLRDHLARAADLFDRSGKDLRILREREPRLLQSGLGCFIELIGWCIRFDLGRHARRDDRDEVRQLGPPVEILGQR